MDVSMILKIAGVGFLASALCQVLSKSGKDEQAGFVTLAGIVIVLLMLVQEIASLIQTVRSTFGI